MHPEQIKAAMRMNGVTSAVLADELGVSSVTVSQVISGRSTSKRIANRIAQIVGQPVEVLWPPQPRLVLRRTKSAGALA